MRVGGHGLEVESSAAGHLGSSENAGSDSVGLESESLRGCQVMQMLLACGPHCVYKALDQEVSTLAAQNSLGSF